MNFKDRIISITDSDKEKRFEKITSQIVLPHFFQEDPWNETKNIVIPAKTKYKVTVMAHWDVFPGSKGYNDNSTGVSILLALQDELPDHVELVFTDGEECGGLGSKLYLQTGVRPMWAINLDVVGLGDTIFYEKYAERDNRIEVPGLKQVRPYENIPFSDSRIFERAGIPNVLFLTGKNKQSLINDIFRAQHCGSNDGDFSLIQEETLRYVYALVMTMLKK